MYDLLMISTRKSPIVKDPFQLAVLFFSATIFLVYNGVVGLHDIAHYVTAGVQRVRDSSYLTYPYDSFNPGINQSVYDYYQRNSQVLDLGVEYPSSGYTILFGIGYLFTGKILFVLAHMITAVLFCLSNVLLFRALRNVIKSDFAALIGVITIPFFVVVKGVIYPSNGVFEYFAVSVLLWSIYSAKLDLTHLSMILGTLAVFRPQVLFLIPSLFFLDSSRLLLHEKLLRLFSFLILSVTFYRISDLFIRSIFMDVGEISEGNSYVTGLKSSLIQAGSIQNALSLMFENTIRNVLSVFSVNSLFFLTIIPLLLFWKALPNLARGLILAGIVVSTPALAIYSLDPVTPIQPRYFTMTLIFFVFAGIIAGMSYRKFANYLKIGSLIGIFAITFSFYYGNFGFPLSSAINPHVLKSKLLFLQLESFPEVLSKNFSKRDVMLVNHAYFSGQKQFEHVLPVPTFSEFYSGDNRGIGGILLVNASDPINGFFNREDFKVAGRYPDKIVDENGVTFYLVGQESSCIDEIEVACVGRVDFYAYKNQSLYPSFLSIPVGYEKNLSSSLLKSPNFENLQDWAQSGSAGINGWDVGPGNDATNVLRQTFSVEPNSDLLLTWRARSAKEDTSLGRFQILWLTKDSAFISAESSKYYLDSRTQNFSYVVSAPENAFYGVLYGIPVGKTDEITFFELNAFKILP
jgi:hypothetical protein